MEKNIIASGASPTHNFVTYDTILYYSCCGSVLLGKNFFGTHGTFLLYYQLQFENGINQIFSNVLTQ